MSEVRRGIIRITTNYGRLFSTLAIGLALVPIQLAWLGTNGFGLLMAVGATVGLAAMLRDIIRHSMVRELGAVWHLAISENATSEDREKFRSVYAAAFWLCAGASIVTALIFVGFAALLENAIWPFEEMPEAYREGGLWILISEGIGTTLLVLLAPAYNMYVVTERFLANNIWDTLRRACYLISAVVLFSILGTSNPEQSLILYGVCSAGLCVILLLIAVALIMIQMPLTRPHLGKAKWSAMREIGGTFGWNGGVITAMNLHERIGLWIMLGTFGLWGSTVFALALRLVGYVRMLTLGLSFGLDAVSARLTTSSTGHEDDATQGTLRAIVHHSTRLHGYVAFPAAITVFLLAEPLLRIWIGGTVTDPDPETGRAVISAAAVLVQIMVFGMASRAIADGWMKILYGAGHIRRYAPIIFAGGIANPLITFALIYSLPEGSRYQGAAWGFAFSLVIAHFLLLPAAGASKLGMTWAQMLGALWRPFWIAAIASVVYLIALTSTLWWVVLIVCSCYCLLYAILCFFLGLEPSERKGVSQLLKRKQSPQSMSHL
ncbi:MAG: hypothetical protein P8J86_08640 [Phycisphaerales bacterium]|nr:hypothetical protein [Phycisphaerales bacterium]